MESNKIYYDYAMAMVGLPYRWGGSNPVMGFDCSGLVIELMQAVGKLPHGFDTTSRGLYKRFTTNDRGEEVDHAVFGCLSFYGASKNRISHVGFCLDANLMLEAGGGGGKTLTKDDAAQANAFVRIRPIQYRKDFLCIVRPSLNFD